LEDGSTFMVEGNTLLLQGMLHLSCAAACGCPCVDVDDMWMLIRRKR
jgi:hypothetical protein